MGSLKHELEPDCEQERDGQTNDKGYGRIQGKGGEDIQPMLLKLRSQAMQYPSFVCAENLIGEKDNSSVVTVSTWERVEDWKVWEKSSTRQELLRQAETLLVEEPRVTIYRIVPTVRRA